MPNFSPRFGQRPVAVRRSGFTLVETIGTCLLLGIVFSMTIPMLLVIARERRTTQQRQFALQHAANLLEHPVTRRWSELEPGELNLPDASSDLQSVLPGLQRKLTVRQIEGDKPVRQIVASIRWLGTSGQMVGPVTLSAWVFPQDEGDTP